MKKEERYRKLQEGIQHLLTMSDSFLVELPWEDAPLVLAAWQLALRHPGVDDYARQRLTEIVEGIICTLESLVPEIGPALRVGYGPDDPLRN